MTFELLPRGITLDPSIRLPRYNLGEVTAQNTTVEYHTGKANRDTLDYYTDYYKKKCVDSRSIHKGSV